MKAVIERYYWLKQQQKEIEQEAARLREQITSYCAEQRATRLEEGDYLVKIIHQQRKEYDDKKLYGALPDPEIWRMMSKSDPAKIASLIKLNILSEEGIRDTYHTKEITIVQVERK